MFQLSVEGDATAVLVHRHGGFQEQHLLKAGAWLDGAALTESNYKSVGKVKIKWKKSLRGFHLSDAAAELAVLEHRNVHTLLHHCLNLLHHLVAVVAYANVHRYVLIVIVELQIQSIFLIFFV